MMQYHQAPSVNRHAFQHTRLFDYVTELLSLKEQEPESLRTCDARKQTNAAVVSIRHLSCLQVCHCHRCCTPLLLVTSCCRRWMQHASMHLNQVFGQVLWQQLRLGRVGGCTLAAFTCVGSLGS